MPPRWLRRLVWVGLGWAMHAGLERSRSAPDPERQPRVAGGQVCIPTYAVSTGLPDAGEPTVPCSEVGPATATEPALGEDRPAPDSRPHTPRQAPDLPRMPGTDELRVGAKWDGDRRAWVRTLALEVPAPQGQVAAFYRKALVDAGLQVQEVEGVPDTEGVVPQYLKGRKVGEHVHVAVRQAVDQLRTRVRVIWRLFEARSPG